MNENLWQFLKDKFPYMFDSELREIMFLILHPLDFIVRREYSGWWGIIPPDGTEYPKWEYILTTTNNTENTTWINSPPCNICNKYHNTQTHSYELEK